MTPDAAPSPAPSPTPRRLTAGALARLLDATPADGVDPTTLPDVTGAAHHDAHVRPGTAFFALPGATHHGLEHADAALAAGASLVVSDRPHPRGFVVEAPGDALLALGRWARARLRGPVIGVTGSAGKTTARALLTAGLGAAASEGNLNTPHALAGRLVRAWSEDDGAPLVLEMGIDHVGEMARLVDLVRPDVGLLTAIAAAHLDGLGDVATVAREKGRLLHGAARGVAAIDAWRRLAPELQLRVAPYGLVEADAGPWPDAPDVGLWRAHVEGPALAPTLEAVDPDGGAPIRVALPGPGRGLAESAVGVLAVADRLGLDPRAAAARLPHARFEDGRLQVRRDGARLVLDDTYNANPASMAQALEVLHAAPGPRVALLGDMAELADEADAAHRAMAEAARGLEHVLYAGTHADAVRAGHPGVTCTTFDGLLALARELPREGTVLVKASRSGRFERVVAALLGEDA
ncbi:MAG: Mur ligase family protein [Trueperaceae bacterium]|nr:Mur ligase family protein [Trueperaceae bacterium]